ncbi:gentamicin 3 -n-acetyltransferase : Aac(3) Ic OS=Pseudomonas aeruginosa GN=aac(3)-Ic PE=4 SV=1: Acetyltransf_1 [Tuwongella immobilis]|uniref:N-acetyltransferase domain-containing protein n=2 Tax=Tuwongella immobilis TaxID=692036 RepID=A0A6C2YVR3_9BACT|nr:gentamicin 3 -n-acetyltransferase : Aac(3) Ic OS=Pseudomonas aeruginosa GN=aac(3)-Ic PE=4 SV=1: Acetyltransf_1 [Tuwongella immobilis]VTS07348.1 gentamicin 3 -n-acetyltransferase : Aac(3) Ic OS=Pseudomonas aeruginosa GN=aac(3)-Ic PE=4 SV=1: Acetyltransf_1 [Tuwongella immobilis]
MRRMLAVFAAAFEEPETYLGNPPSDDYLRQLLAQSHFVAIGGYVGPELAGGLAAYVLPKFEQERSECYIYDLAVAESFRRRGVATAMIRQLQDIAATSGISVIYVQADRVDAPAVALYRKFGPPESVFHFDVWPESPAMESDSEPVSEA